MWLRKKWPYIAIILVATTLGILAVRESSAYQTCKAEYRKQTAEQQQKKGSPSFASSQVRSIWTTAVCTTEAIDAVEGLLTLLATIAIAWFTGTLWRVSKTQLAHAHHVERAYISGGGIEGLIDVDKGVPLRAFKLAANNFGKTSGEILEFGIGWFEAGEPPPVEPKYEWYYYRDQLGAGVQSRQLSVPPVRIPPHFTRPVTYGRYGYKDIFGGVHSDGWVQEGGTPFLAPNIFTESDPPGMSRG